MFDAFHHAGFTKSTSYEYFMLAVSLLAMINMVIYLIPFTAQTNEIIIVIDNLIALLFFADFLIRFFSASKKLRYFFVQFGWADLLASVPLISFNIFRIFRIIRFLAISKKVGLHKIGKLMRHQFINTTMYGVFFLIILVLEFGSIGVLAIEHNAPDANIVTANDALWWTFVSITTVGYGDLYPVTDAGRLIGVVTLTVGVGLFGVITGYVANMFVHTKQD